MIKQLSNPYEDLLPPLSTEEFAALKVDIKDNGVRIPIDVDEDGNILDGHHRYKIDKNAPRRVVKGLSEAEKRAFVFRSNFMRRNLSASQKKEATRQMKTVAKALREEDAKKWTQAALAKVFGVDRSTVSLWFTDTRSNVNIHNASTPVPDARVKVNPKHKPVIAARVQAGDPQAQVAADYGVSQRQVSTIVKEETKHQETKKQWEARGLTTLGRDVGVECGDFRELMPKLEDESVAMIFTDPPYNEESISLYGEIARLAAKKLMPSGWMLAYCGKSHLPQAMRGLCEHLTYGWTFAVFNHGGDARFRNLKLMTAWKPIIGVYRPPLKAAWDWFKDVISGGREKSDHEWQQALREAEHFIAAMCPAGGLVLDPCCGSGTTLLAAKNLERKWLGYEIDPTHAATAKGKLL